jgi:hypothetical protein
MESVIVTLFKMPFETTHFNKNQKVWVTMFTGAMAAKVTGKFRGKGKYIEAWVNWDKGNRKKYPFPEFKEIKIHESFAKKHGLLIKRHRSLESGISD